MDKVANISDYLNGGSYLRAEAARQRRLVRHHHSAGLPRGLKQTNILSNVRICFSENLYRCYLIWLLQCK